MRAITRVMSGAVLMLSLGAVPAVAQASFSLGAGLTFPSGALSEGINTGFHGLAGVSFVPGGSPSGFEWTACTTASASTRTMWMPTFRC